MTEEAAVTTETTTLAGAEPEAGAPAPEQPQEAAPVEENKTDTSAEAEGQGDKPEASDEAGEQESNTESPAETLELTAPEGFEAFADDFAAFNKDMGEWLKANPEAKTADVLKEAAARQARVAAEQLQNAVKDRNARTEQWEAEARKHERIGGENLERVLANVKAVRDKTDSQAVFAALEETGLGSNPIILEALSLLGERMTDSGVHGTPRAAGGDSLAARYPKTSG